MISNNVEQQNMGDKERVAQSDQEAGEENAIDRRVMDDQGRGAIPSGHEAESGDGEEESDPSTNAGK